jgi:hypothetical protein
MKYLSEIVWLVSWPILIYFSYKLSEFAINKYKRIEEKNRQKE